MEIERQEAEVLHRKEADNRQSDGIRKTGGRSRERKQTTDKVMEIERQEAEILHREEVEHRQIDGVRKTGGRSTERKQTTDKVMELERQEAEAQRGSRQQTKRWR